jgi:hypothetical protein
VVVVVVVVVLLLLLQCCEGHMQQPSQVVVAVVAEVLGEHSDMWQHVLQMGLPSVTGVRPGLTGWLCVGRC